MQNSPQFKSLSSSLGVPYDAITGIQQVGEDRYALIVKNDDTEGPLTEGGTSDDQDPLTEFDGATLKRIFENGLGGVMNDGGWDSQASQIYATMKVDSVSRDNMVNAAAGVIGADTSQLAQNGNADGVAAGRRASFDLNDASYDELSQILVEGGMSAEDVSAQFPRPAAPEAGASENPRLPSAAESGNTAIASLEALGISFDRSEDGAFGAMQIPDDASPRLKTLLRGFESRRMGARADVNDPDSMTDAADQSRSRMATSSAEKVQEYASGLEAEIARLEAEPEGSGHSKRNKKTKLRNARRDFEILNPSAVTPESTLGEGEIDAPDTTLTRENMIKKITEDGYRPEPKTTEQMASYLRARGVGSIEDLRKIPTREQTLAMAVLATSDADASVAQQQELLQKMFNLVERGSMDYTLPNQIDDQGNAATLAQRITEFNKAERKLFDDTVVKVSGELENITVQAGAKGDDYVRWNDTEFTAPIRDLFRVFNNTAEGPAKLAYGQAAAEAMGIALKKYATEKNPRLVERIQNIFRSEGLVDYSIDDISKRIVISPDGQTFGFIDPLDNAGIVEGEIPMAVARSLFGDDLSKVLERKAQLNPPVAM
jgi:hypothetical protein